MTSTGWDIAIRNIDKEFDIPQFVASSLIRKIAANRFRLPASERANFQPIPDAVIVRVEQIVREAYLEAGEDIDGEILREHLREQALLGRRDMVARGEFLTLTDFKKRINTTEKRLARLVEDGSLFAIDVDNSQYIPALLADPTLNRRRLRGICRIIVPAPPPSRLDFLMSPSMNLGHRSPLQLLDDDHDFKRLQVAATAWAAGWSRTAVTMYEGEHETEPNNVEPLYTAMAEIDPRRLLWERASEALHVHGYEWPLGPYPDVRSFTLFVTRQAAGDSTPIPEACVQINIDGEYLKIRIKAAPGTALQSKTARATKHKSFIAIAKQVIIYLKTNSAVLGKFLRDVTLASPESGAATDEIVSTSEAAAILFVSRVHVLKLIDDGLLPLHHRVGKHQFVRKADVLAYKAQKLAEAKAWLDSQTEGTDPSGQ